MYSVVKKLRFWTSFVGTHLC